MCEYSHATDRILSQTYHLSVSLFACKHIICPCAWTLTSRASRCYTSRAEPKTLMSKSGRWHRTTTNAADAFRSVVSFGISNEKLWDQGLFYKGLHIGTKDDDIANEYDWWSYGRRDVEGSRWINLHASPVHTSMSQVHGLFARGLIRATLRNVKESVLPILRKDVSGKTNEHRARFMRYVKDAVRRAALKYGRDSEQYRLLNAWLYEPGSKKADEVSKAILKRQWTPSWKTMIRLEEDQPDFGPRKPRAPPKTLRRKRLLRPRPPPTSATVMAHPPWSSSYRMKSIFSDDVTPESKTVSSEEDMHLERPSETRRSWSQKYRMRSIHSPDSPGQQAMKSPLAKRRAERRHAENSRSRSSKYRMLKFLSHDIGPEEADVSSSGKEGVASPPPDEKAARSQTATHPREGARSALDITPETKTVSSGAKGRGPRTVSRTRRKRRTEKYVPQNLVWW